ncbi:MAG TPA: ATP synthase F0 subunit A [Candidatus Magasanikbacteria bacterium]|nr:ATP synthase F0 subunit A [Candidatus Magasanikbacteria bacterium]
MTLPPIQAEVLFHIAGLPVTNSMINAWIAVLFFVVVGVAIKTTIKKRPGKFQNFVEWVFEFMLGFFDQVTGDRKKSERFLPFVGTLFLFILFSNWIGLMPGTGSIGLWQMHQGELELIPLLRPANADLNMTLAMAVLAVVFSHVVGIITIGFFKHANKFIQLGTLWKSFRKGGINILTGIIDLGVGLLEIISEIAKMVSLSLRLFGNVFAGEVLLTVIGGIIAFVVPLPFMGLELLVGIIQATVFTMLALVYLTVATTDPHGAEEH